jgi:hypothetical protein
MGSNLSKTPIRVLPRYQKCGFLKYYDSKNSYRSFWWDQKCYFSSIMIPKTLAGVFGGIKSAIF